MSSVTKSRAQEVLYESEAALRLLDHELQQLHDVERTVVDTQSCDCEARFELAASQVSRTLVRLRDGRALIASNRDDAARQLADTMSLLDEMELRMTEVAHHCRHSTAQPVSADDLFPAIKGHAA